MDQRSSAGAGGGQRGVRYHYSGGGVGGSFSGPGGFDVALASVLNRNISKRPHLSGWLTISSLSMCKILHTLHIS